MSPPEASQKTGDPELSSGVPHIAHVLNVTELPRPETNELVPASVSLRMNDSITWGTAGARGGSR